MCILNEIARDISIRKEGDEIKNLLPSISLFGLELNPILLGP